MPKKGTLTKAHIVKAVIEQSGFTQKKSFETVETRLEIIKSTLESGEDVLISGFGKFCVKKNMSDEAETRPPERTCCWRQKRSSHSSVRGY